MKPNRYIFWLIFTASCLMLPGCKSLVSDELEEECKKDDLASSEVRNVILGYKLTPYLDLPAADHKAFDAETIEIQGNLRKMNCRNIEDSFLEVNTTVLPSLYTGDEAYTIDLTPEYKWTFVNYKDYFSFTFTMTASFSDGTIYKADESTQNSAFYQSMMVFDEPLLVTIYTPNVWKKVK